MKSIARVFELIAITAGVGFMCLTENNSAGIQFAFLFAFLVALALRGTMSGRGRW